MTVVTVTVVKEAVVIVTYFIKIQLDTLTTNEMFSGQHFAILAMFIYVETYISQDMNFDTQKLIVQHDILISNEI